MPRKLTVTDFSEIFEFAGKAPYNVHWYRCCDIFHSNLIVNDEGKNTTLYLNDLKDWIEHFKEKGEEKYKDQILAREILVDFMKHHKLEEMFVENN